MVQAGCFVLEYLDELDQPRPRGDGGEQADSQAALDLVSVLRRSLQDARKLLIGGIDVGQEALAGRRQRHAPAGAMHEALAELELELAKALADPRLRDPEPLGGPPEVELLGESEEDPDLA